MSGDSINARFEPIEVSLFPACTLPGCRNLVDEDGDACPACLDLWGPYICRKGDKPAWWPSGWVRRDGGWGIPWGVAADPEVAREQRLAAAAALALEQDLRRAGLTLP